jgi:glycosyltransferase involved in cell wall biosynthesis
MEKTLILLTSGYPYGIYDDFLHNEIQFLKKYFKKIHFIVPEYTSHLKLRVLDFEYTISKVKKMSKLSFLFSNPTSIIQLIHDLKHSDVKISIQSIKIALDFQLNAKSYQLTIHKLLKNQKTKLFFYSYWFDYRALALTDIKKKHPNYVYFSRAHGYDIYKERQPNRYQPFKKNSFELDKIYPISDIGKRYLTENFRIPETKIQTSRLGVFSSEILKSSSDQNHIKILSCSNVVSIKRIHLIVESLSLFGATTKIHWVHIGDGELRPDLENLANKKLTDSIKFSFLGEINNNEVRNFYIKFEPQIFINTSSTEGIPVSIMEAFSFGIPAIATDVGGTSEIVNNQNGILLSENPTPHEIKAAIEEVITHPEKREAAYQTWNELYNAEKNYVGFVKKLTEFSDPL